MLTKVLFYLILYDQRRPTTKMEDDEDLEFLRLAALKSLNIKKDASVIPSKVSSSASTAANVPSEVKRIASHNSRVNRIPAMNAAAFTTGLIGPNESYYGNTADIRRDYRDYPLVDKYHGGILEQLETSDPYLAQPRHPLNMMPEYGKSPANNYVPQPPNTDILPISNVQLSPRSAAFVLQNNDILMRRKGARSPSPYRKESARWSVTPPPVKHRSPNHSPSNYYYRRSESRSPVHRTRSPRRSPRRSPLKRTQSRSPQRYAPRRYSPGQVKRTKSRSPNRNAYAHRGPTTIEPIARPRLPGNRENREIEADSSNRRNSPYRNGPKNWRGHSPVHHSQSTRSNGGHQRRSQSPRNEVPATKRRTRSPIAAKSDVRKRSNSRSPGRKYGREGPPGKKRKSPMFATNRKPNRGDNGPHSSSTDQSRNSRRGRSPSPRHRRRSGSRTRNQPNKSDVHVHANANDRKNDDEPKSAEKKKELGNNIVAHVGADSAEANDKTTTERTLKETEEEPQVSSDDDDDSNNDDGIDLFASEESESENEGRFKSSSNKTERTASIATLSFSKLGTTNAPVVRDLNEVRSDKPPSSSRKERDDNATNSRDRDRNRNGRDSYPNRRAERFGKSDRDLERSRGRSGNSWKNDARKDDDKDGDKNKKHSSKFSNKTNDSRKGTAEEGKQQSAPICCVWIKSTLYYHHR